MTNRLPAIAALLGLTVSGCATTAGTATPAAPAPMATADTLDTFLLLGGQVSAAFGSATDLVVTRDVTAPWNDSAPLSDRGVGCLAIAGAAQSGVYAGSGYTAMHGQVLREPPTSATWSHFATQAVVLFPTAASAAAFFTRSRGDWADCSSRELTYAQQPAPDQVWSIGPVSVDRDVLAVSRTQRSPQRWSCQRALTVHSNVAVDVEACSLQSPTTAATQMARTITERLGPA